MTRHWIFVTFLSIWGTCVFVGNWVGNRLGSIILNWAELNGNCVIENLQSSNSSIVLSSNQETFLESGPITTGDWLDIYPNTTIPIIECSDSEAWKKVFYLPAFITLSWGIVTFCLTYNDSPKNYKNITTIHTINSENSKELKKETEDENKKDEENISLWNVLKTIPTAWFLAFGYFAVKGGRLG